MIDCVLGLFVGRMGFVYSKRCNMVEFVVCWEFIVMFKYVGVIGKVGIFELKFCDLNMGWLGMMSIRLYELDGMYDYLSLFMVGDCY